ncbi:MAG: hypothetical protein ACRCU1_00935 [Alsobacter sp.]
MTRSTHATRRSTAILSRAQAQAATLSGMKTPIERAVAALEYLPEDLRERHVERLEEQAEKLRVMRHLVQEGLDDVEAGRVSPFDMKTFLAEARKRVKTERPD